MQDKFNKMNDFDSITKKILITRYAYKELKKIAIDLDLDDDGKVPPESLGECVNYLVKNSVEVKFNKTNDLSSVTKKILITKDTYKILKKLTIDLDLDDDGKILPEMLGECVNYLVKNNS